jgi:hypothetical protein
VFFFLPPPSLLSAPLFFVYHLACVCAHFPPLCKFSPSGKTIVCSCVCPTGSLCHDSEAMSILLSVASFGWLLNCLLLLSLLVPASVSFLCRYCL